LLGEVPPLEGEVRLGASLRVGYFAQAHEGLSPERTALEELVAAAPGMKPGEARTLLGRFLFHGDSVEKPVAVLSGGERGRLALAKLVVEGANLLLLDEPTTHLDIPSQEVLQEALADFPGTVLLVSHDRYLVSALASQVWVIEPEARELAVYRGGYAELAESRERARQEEKRAASRSHQPSATPRKAAAGERRLEDVEREIAEPEAALAEISKAIEAAGSDVEKVRELGTRYAALQADLEIRLGEWAEQEGSGGKSA
jgi:ATP-binding cassette subfamily F protein 3